MFCVQCGGKFSEKHKFCGSCGTNLQTQNKEELGETKILKVVSPSEEIKGKVSHTRTSTSKELLETYVGEEKLAYYFGKWEKNEIRSWNWSAFLVTYYWLGYRKMYKVMLCIMVLFIVLDITMLLAGIDRLKMTLYSGIAISIGLGISGNYLYKKYAEKEIKKLKRHYSGIQLLKAIKQRGGVSWIGFWIAFTFVIGYIAISFFLNSVIYSITEEDSNPGRVKVIDLLESVDYQDKNSDSVVNDNHPNNYTVLEAPNLFDFSIEKKIDINNDGVVETVKLVGGKEKSNSYMNENIQIKVENDTTEAFINVKATNIPVLYIYDINQDGWMELFFQTSDRSTTVEVYHFGNLGLESYAMLEGEITDLEPFVVTTTEDTYRFDDEITADSISYLEAKSISERSCISCHGGDLAGGMGPALDTVGSNLSQEEIEEVILNGKGSMPGGLLSVEEAKTLSIWLETLK